MYGILIYDGIEPIDIGAAFGVLSMAKRIAPDLDFVGVARTAGPVTCAHGLVVIADHGFADCPELTDLVVTGGPGWQMAAQDPETLEFVRKSKARISSICTGAMILAAAGSLDDRKATTKREVFEGETAPLHLLPDRVERVSAAIVEDDGVVTGGGVSLGLDTMFHVLARSHGQHVADETARVMEYTRALAANKAALGYAL